MQMLLDTLLEKNRKWTKKGKLADYIPELANIDPSVLGLSMVDMKGDIYNTGNYDYKFTMQSITKVITLMIALMENGIEKVFEHVGMEPTGDPFNSIIRLETVRPSKPLNPMINAGAISTVSLLSGNPEERFHKILHLIQKMAHNDTINYNGIIYQSENTTGDLNRALAFFMRNYGVIDGNIEEHIEVYFKQSSIEIDTTDLAKIASVIANNGRDVYTGEQIIPSEIVRIAKTFMVTCGMYNASGEFAIKVGIPAKSGVGGGIMAVVPNKYGIGVVGPALDDKGNSLAGVNLLRELSDALDLSIF